MRLLQLLRREAAISPWFVLMIACISGISNALVLTIINAAAALTADDAYGLYLLGFVLTIGVYLGAQAYILTTTIHEVEGILHRLRLQIMNKIRDAELGPLEHLGRARIYAGIAQDMQTISDAAMPIVMMCQAAILILFTLVYMAYLSLVALGLFLVVGTITVGFYWLKTLALRQDILTSVSLEHELFECMTHLLDGFKEVKMNTARSVALQAHLDHISTAVLEMKSRVRSQTSLINIVAQTSFYILVALVGFVLPHLQAETEASGQIATAVLFLTGPITALVAWVQNYARANVAAEQIEDLMDALDQHVRPAAQRGARPLVLQGVPFRDIVFDHVVFDFVTTDGAVSFRLGPLDLTITAGETLFITGGNGSGKSTFLLLVTCLYFPTQGAVLIDGQRLSEANAEGYRDLFSTIFYDYHLFDRLYGLPEVDRQLVEALLTKLQLQDKTSIQAQRFTTLNLSSGQKRRLALLVMYLENKPICVFDEWAAEQDPEFRRYFYTTLLPELKAQGKTLLVVTHDEHYYDMAYVDHRLKLEEGRLVPYTVPQ